MSLDPQMFYPRADHKRLSMHDYWDPDFETSDYLDVDGARPLAQELCRKNHEIGSALNIVPGVMCEEVTEDWMQLHSSLITAMRECGGTVPEYATLCLSSDVLLSELFTEEALNVASSWPVEGIYLIAGRPFGQYLVEDPVWMTNLLSLCAGLRIQGKKVMAGYTSPQMLALAAAGVNTLGSGNYRNVRMFGRARFYSRGEDEIARRAVWYYCPHALTEFKVPFLDLAFRVGRLKDFRPSDELLTDYVRPLFAGGQPSSARFREPEAFRHYLNSMRYQATRLVNESFLKTVTGLERRIKLAQGFLKEAHAIGVLGQDRDFALAADATLAGLSALRVERGFVLERKWADLHS